MDGQRGDGEEDETLEVVVHRALGAACHAGELPGRVAGREGIAGADLALGDDRVDGHLAELEKRGEDEGGEFGGH